MRYLLLAAALLPVTALAQTTQPTATPEQQAMGQTIMACVQQEINLRAQLVTLQAQLDELKAKQAASKVPDTKPEPPK
jgi:hypothetical protein